MSKAQPRKTLTDSINKTAISIREKYALLRRGKTGRGGLSGQPSTLSGSTGNIIQGYYSTVSLHHAYKLIFSDTGILDQTITVSDIPSFVITNTMSPTLSQNNKITDDASMIMLTDGFFRRLRIKIVSVFLGRTGIPYGTFYININGVDTSLFIITPAPFPTPPTPNTPTTNQHSTDSVVFGGTIYVNMIFDTGYMQNVTFKSGDRVFMWFDYQDNNYTPLVITGPNSHSTDSFLVYDLPPSIITTSTIESVVEWKAI